MKFILAVTDINGKNLIFISREMQALSLTEATEAVRRGNVPGVYVVERKTGTYIRSKITVPKIEQFEKISMQLKDILLYAQGFNSDSQPLRKYVEAYTSMFRKDQIIIKPFGYLPILAADIKERIVPRREDIIDAARQFNIDPYLLGAILIDESARLIPFEPIIDAINGGILGKDTSVGIAQVKLATANSLIKKGFYNPNPDDKALPFKKLNNAAQIYLYKYVVEPKHNIFFSAAFIRSLIDEWRKSADLSKRPEIIATLYHRGHVVPHSEPKPDERGRQIALEFYQMATQWLQKP